MQSKFPSEALHRLLDAAISRRFLTIEDCKALKSYWHGPPDASFFSTILSTLQIPISSDHLQELLELVRKHASSKNCFAFFPRLFDSHSASPLFRLLSSGSDLAMRILEEILCSNKRMIYASFHAFRKADSRSSTSFSTFSAEIVEMLNSVFEALVDNHSFLVRLLRRVPVDKFVSETEAIELILPAVLETLVDQWDATSVGASLELLQMLCVAFPSVKVDYNCLHFAKLVQISGIESAACQTMSVLLKTRSVVISDEAAYQLYKVYHDYRPMFSQGLCLQIAAQRPSLLVDYIRTRIAERPAALLLQAISNLSVDSFGLLSSSEIEAVATHLHSIAAGEGLTLYLEAIETFMDVCSLSHLRSLAEHVLRHYSDWYKSASSATLRALASSVRALSFFDLDLDDLCGFLVRILQARECRHAGMKQALYEESILVPCIRAYSHMGSFCKGIDNILPYISSGCAKLRWNALAGLVVLLHFDGEGRIETGELERCFAVAIVAFQYENAKVKALVLKVLAGLCKYPSLKVRIRSFVEQQAGTAFSPSEPHASAYRQSLSDLQAALLE